MGGVHAKQVALTVQAKDLAQVAPVSRARRRRRWSRQRWQEAVSRPELWVNWAISEFLLVQSLIRVTSSAIAFRARSQRHASDVFVKLYARGIEGSEHRAARFWDEGTVLGFLGHPCVPKFLEVGVSHGHPYIVTSFVDGLDLHGFGARLAATLPHTSTDTIGIRRALAAKLVALVCDVHTRGVVHRDIKPSNLIVSTQETLFLVDWGIAYCKALTPGAVPSRARTKVYASPERIAGDRGDTCAEDAYAVGVILAELVTGLQPEALRSQHPRLLMMHPGAREWDRRLVEATARMLGNDPQERVRGLAHAAEALGVR